MSTPLEPTDGLDTEGEENLENAIELKDVEGLSQGQIVRERFFRHRGALVGLITLALVVLLAYTSIGATTSAIPGWWKSDPNTPGKVVNGGLPDHAPAELAGRDRLRDRRPPLRPGRDRSRHLRADHEGHPDLDQRDGHHQHAGGDDRDGRSARSRATSAAGSTSC